MRSNYELVSQVDEHFPEVKGNLTYETLKVIAECPYCHRPHQFKVNPTGIYVCKRGLGSYEIRIWK